MGGTPENRQMELTEQLDAIPKDRVKKVLQEEYKKALTEQRERDSRLSALTDMWERQPGITPEVAEEMIEISHRHILKNVHDASVRQRLLSDVAQELGLQLEDPKR